MTVHDVVEKMKPYSYDSDVTLTVRFLQDGEVVEKEVRRVLVREGGRYDSPDIILDTLGGADEKVL